MSRKCINTTDGSYCYSSISWRDRIHHAAAKLDAQIGRPFAIRIRVAFLLLTLPVVIGSLIIAVFVSQDHQDHHGFRDLRQFAHRYQQTIVFVSICSAMINSIAAGAAIFNCTRVLFVYVVLTAIVGIAIGIVATVGLVIACIMMPHRSPSDHTIAITAMMLIALIVLFYLLTILALKLIANLRRRSRAHRRRSSTSLPIYDNEAGGDDDEEGSSMFHDLRSSHQSKQSKQPQRIWYKSIDSNQSPNLLMLHHHHHDDHDRSIRTHAAAMSEMDSVFKLQLSAASSSNKGFSDENKDDGDDQLRNSSAKSFSLQI